METELSRPREAVRRLAPVSPIAQTKKIIAFGVVAVLAANAPTDRADHRGQKN
ncbi:MAG TPA: hypothetical protein VFP16_01940 [Vicinamibacterales bacterium]|nr:hypothetical protein [Vicinamibacterales bacterium]